ncbi:MAG: phage tail tube protein [bacterium]
MGWASNASSQLLLDFETAFKTPPVSAAAIKLPFGSCDLKVDQKPQSSTILGAGRHAARPFYGNKTVTGNLTGPVDLIAIGYILKMVFGAPTTTGSSDPYTHTFKIGALTPSFLLEKGWPNESRFYLYTGCKAGGFSISFGGNGELRYTVPIIGAKEEYSASSYQESPTVDVSRPATIFHNCDAAASEGGSAIDTLEEISFNFQNNTVMGFGLAGSGEGTIAGEGTPALEGKIKGMFDADTLIAKGRNHTKSSLSVTCTLGTHSIAFLADELEYSHESPAIQGPGGAYLDLSFIGYYQNAAAASDFRVILINSQASYA